MQETRKKGHGIDNVFFFPDVKKQYFYPIKGSLRVLVTLNLLILNVYCALNIFCILADYHCSFINYDIKDMMQLYL